MALTIGQMILWGTNSPPAEVSTGDSNTNVDIKFSVLNKGLNEYFIMLIYVLRWWPSWISDRHTK